MAPPHLLKGLLHNDVGLASWVAALGKDVHFLRDWADYRIEMAPRSGKVVENPPSDAATLQVFQLADLMATQFESMEVEPVHVLAALLKPNIGFSADQMKSLPIAQKE